MTAPLVEFRSVGLSFGGKRLFAGASFTLERGGALAVVGREGSGKTAILKLCLGMLLPSEGAVLVDGKDTREMTPADLKSLRVRAGFIQQAGGLLANLTLLDNILLPLRYHNLLDGSRQAEVAALAESLDLAAHLARLPGELPEAVQRRARLARALALRPELLLADHPVAGVAEDVAAMIVRHLSPSGPDGRSRGLLAAMHTVKAAQNLAGTVRLLDNEGLHPA